MWEKREIGESRNAFGTAYRPDEADKARLVPTALRLSRALRGWDGWEKGEIMEIYGLYLLID
jgi:hypothetical protein